MLQLAPPTPGGPPGTDRRPSGDTARGSGLPYLPGLDGVRAVAVAAVLLFHLPAMLLPGGFLGVDVFFVLSGFLITSLLLEELDRHGAIRFGRFYLRRARRLLPALIAVLLVTSVLVLTVARDAASQFREDAVAAVTYTTNWWYVFDERSYFDLIGRPPMLQHLWSLAVEEQFYLVWPVLALLVWRIAGRRGVGLVATAGALAATAWMATLAVAQDVPATTDTARLYFGSDTHAMTVLAGAALATVWRPSRLPDTIPDSARRFYATVGVLSLVALTAAFLVVHEDTAWLYRGGFLVVAAVTCALVLAASHPAAPFGRWFGNPVMRWLGTRSYGIYLWHWPIFLVTRPELDLPYGGWAAAATSLTLTGLAAEASYRWVEMPVRRGAVGDAWRRIRSAGPGRRLGYGAAAVVTASALVACGAAVASVPEVGTEDYLGGVTAVGAGALPLATGGGSEGRAAGNSATAGRARQVADPAPLGGGGITAVGDSVLLGARSEITDRLPRVTIDAEISRQPYDTIDRIRQRVRAGALADVLLIQTGTNGVPSVGDMRGLLVSLEQLDRIVVVNVRSPVPWMDRSNQALAAATRGLPNVALVDWAAQSAGRGEYFVADGTHLTPVGAAAYAEAIRAALA